MEKEKDEADIQENQKKDGTDKPDPDEQEEKSQ